MAITLGETHILGLAGVTSSVTAWRVYQMLLGNMEIRGNAGDTLALAMRKAAIAELTVNRNARMKGFEGPLSFEGPFHATKPTIAIADGPDPIEVGDVVMLEMPTRSDFDRIWQSGYETGVPPAVAARANVRMAVADAPRAVAWVVGDNGKIDEFHVIERDEDVIADLRYACRGAVTAAAAGEEPSPDDDDLHDYLARRDGGNSVLRVEAGSEVAAAFLTYREGMERKRESDAISRSYGKAADEAAVVLKRAMRDAPVLLMPSGEEVTVKPYTKTYTARQQTFDRVIVRPAPASPEDK